MHREGINIQDNDFNKIRHIDISYVTKKDIFFCLEQINNYKSCIQYIDTFLQQKGWKFDQLNRVYYKGNTIKTKTDFHSFSKHKKSMSSLDLLDFCNDFYKSASILRPLPIVGSTKDTFFVVSGIQNIYSKSDDLYTQFLVHQPSIRLSGDGDGGKNVSGTEGIATSFINTTLFQNDSNMDQHMKLFDDFLSFLSNIGIFIGDINLTLRIGSDKRNDKENISMVIDFHYGNLHLGDCCFVMPEYSGGKKSSFSDLGFGFERIVFARNKYENYFHQYLCNEIEKNRYTDEEIDTIKTLCLIWTEDIKQFDKHDGAGLQYKKLFANLSKDKNYYPLIKLFFSYRENFTSCNFSLEAVNAKILNDLERFL